LGHYDINTGTLTVLNTNEQVEDRSASWSPDGEWLAVVRYVPSVEPSRGDQVWLMRPDGSDARQLTDASNVIHSAPVWSPDGKYLLTHRYSLGEQWAQPGIILLDVETGESRQVVKPGLWATWLP